MSDKRCECVSKIDEKLKELDLKLANTGVAFDMKGSPPTAYVALSLPLVRLDGKKPRSGQPGTFWPSYCPFCGVKIKKDGEYSEDEGAEGEGHNEPDAETPGTPIQA